MTFCSCIAVDPYTVVYGPTNVQRYYTPTIITTYELAYVRPYYVRPYYVRPYCTTTHYNHYYQSRYHRDCRK